MAELGGRVALVTGGASGIGAAVTEALGARGARVVILDKDGPLADQQAEKIRATGGAAEAVHGDVTIEDDIARAVATALETFGRLDILDNNAAALELIPFDDEVTSMQVGVWDAVMAANVRGPMLGCKHAIPAMLRSGGGTIINMGSVSGTRGEHNMIAYGVSKAAVMQLTRAVAARWGKDGIRCHAVAPGLVLTPNTARAMPPARQEIYVRNSLTPYVGRPQDIANVIAFLATDAARYMNGHTVFVDGGLAAALPILAETRP